MTSAEPFISNLTPEAPIVVEPQALMAEVPTEVIDVRVEPEQLPVESGRISTFVSNIRRAGKLMVNNSAQIKDGLIRGVQTSVVLAEISPANEALRLAAFGAAEAYSSGLLTGAIAYGASTLVVEGAGALAAAPLFETKMSDRLFTRLNRRVEEMREDKREGALKIAEVAGSLFGGTVVAMAVKQASDPTRTRAENTRYGLRNAALLSGAGAIQGGLMFEGLDVSLSHPAPAAAVASAAALAAAGWFTKNKVQRGHENLNELSRKRSAELYDQSIVKQTTGPQLEGFTPDDLQKVLKDERTDFVLRSKDNVRWPLLTPIDNFSEYLSGYFTDRFGSTEDVCYLSLPAELSEYDENAIAVHINSALQQGKRLVYDELHGRDTFNKVAALSQAQNPGLKLSLDTFTDEKNLTDAAVIHFGGLGRVEKSGLPDPGSLREAYEALVAEGGVDRSTKNNTILIDPATLEANLANGQTVVDRLWQIYEGQFTNLVENHPARQMQYRHELESMVRDDETLTVAHMIDGDIVSFAMFVGNIETCDWLNADYYQKKFPDDKVLYFPGIATDENKQGQHYALNVIDLVSKIMSRANTDVRVVFQCTNVSAGYIPEIVKVGVESTGAKIDLDELCRYDYRLIELDKK